MIFRRVTSRTRTGGSMSCFLSPTPPPLSLSSRFIPSLSFSFPRHLVDCGQSSSALMMLPMRMKSACLKKVSANRLNIGMDGMTLARIPGIPDGAKFLRHLGTLASWYSGIFYFVRPRNLADTVRIQIVRVAEPPREDDNFRSIDESILTRAADSIRAHASDDMLAAIPPGDTLQDLSAQLRRPSDTSRVHCEASIMALVVEPDVELITPQTTSGWPIGASKKCCWTCWKLGELLGQDGTYFAVSGTHKIIFGWVPPTGLPINVLARVRDALLEEYAKVCEAELKISRRSGQTSPVSDVEDNAKMLS
ncbi:hypothetical protein C8R44DRAFT_106302 [Mycena epipterygia]|nr:hypothetical protein C8R44DRAFT_106302 [Mycena epipterygia]